MGVQHASVVLIFTSPNAPLSRISCFRCLKCKRGTHFRIAKRTPIKNFALQIFIMQAWYSFSRRQTHPYQRFRVSNVQSASAVLIFPSPYASLTRISHFKSLKCECGAHFRVAKHTPIKDFAFRMFKMKAWCSFSSRQMHHY